MNTTLIVPEQKSLLPLDHTLSGPLSAEFYDFIKTHAAGQPRIFKWFAETIESIVQEFCPENGPAASVLLVGPSGVGKTYMVKLFAEFFFGDPKGFTRIDGQDMSLEHHVARLIGAPAGYVGYGDKPMITQKQLDRPAYLSAVRYALNQAGEKVQNEYFRLSKEKNGISEHLGNLGRMSKPDTEKQKVAQSKLDAIAKRLKEIGIPEYDRVKYSYISFLLLDEIERAHQSFHNILFRVLDEGELPLASKQTNEDHPEVLDFSRTVIIATSNLGSNEITKLLRTSSTTLT